MKARYEIFRIFLGCIFLTSCAVGPNYKRPTLNVPAQFKEANLHWKVATPNTTFAQGEWWKLFNDPKLNELEEKLNAANQNIAVAYANYQQAVALVKEARAGFFPIVTGNVFVSRQKSTGSSTFSSISTTGQVESGTATTSASSSSSGSANEFSSHSLSINASWIPDIWGQVRRTVEASRAGAQASAALLANTRLSMQGSLAQVYFSLCMVDRDQKILDNTVESYRKILQLTHYQYDSGVASQAEIVQAQSQLEAAQALAINNKINRALYEHSIAILIGVPPAEFSLEKKSFQQIPPHIPLLIPSELLERRPDIAQAERLMAQANAEIGVAISAFFPTLALTGNVNNSGRGDYADLFSLSNLGWAYGPLLTQIILDGGFRSATVAAARAGYNSTLASYRQTVLSAFQNVEDNLASLRILATQATALEAASQSAKQALQLVMNQYKAGTVPFSSVLVAQTNVYTAEKNLSDTQGLRMTTAVGLILALGGGWDTTQLPQKF